MTRTARGVVTLTGLIVLHALPARTHAQARESRDHTGFTEIAVSGGIDLTLSEGRDFSVEIVASGGDPAEVVTEVEGSTLAIRRRSNVLFGNPFTGYEAHVTLPVLEALSVSGGSDVTGTGVFSGDRLRLSASGGSDVTIAVRVDALDVGASGGSDVDLSGSAERIRVETSGGSDLRARDFQAGEADLRSSGGSDISITVRDRIVARASGGSDIVYRGNPAFVDVDGGRSADIVHR